MPDNKWWEVFPWQTPEGEGFKAPWTKREEPFVSGIGGEQGTYLDRLASYLGAQVAAGKLTEEQADYYYSTAEDSVSSGYFGEALPFFSDTMYGWQPEGMTGGMTEWEKAQQSRWQADRALEERKLEASMAGQSEAAKFEEQRRKLLESYTGAEDWIKRWQVMHYPNPYVPTTSASVLDRPWKAMTPEQRAITMADTAYRPETEAMLRAGYTQGSNYQPAREVEEFGWYPERGFPEGPYPVSSVAAVSGRWIPVGGGEMAQVYEKPGGGAGVSFMGGTKVQRPTTPPAPQWLPAFVPGQVAGQPITKERMRTPSGVKWAGTAPSVQAGLTGYADWAGYRPMEDILAHMQQMKSRTPVTSGRWQPMRGR